MVKQKTLITPSDGEHQKSHDNQKVEVIVDHSKEKKEEHDNIENLKHDVNQVNVEANPQNVPSSCLQEIYQLVFLNRTVDSQ